MIGLPVPNGSQAPTAYGNQQNLSTPGVANNRMGGNVQQTNKPPMMMQGGQQQQQGFAPGGAMPPEQQPMYHMPQPNPAYLNMQEPMVPQNLGGGAGINFGKQYYEQSMPLG